MILVITNSKDATADYLIPILAQHHIACLRLDTDRIASQAKLAFSPGAPVLAIDQRLFVPDDFKAVWYRRPERLADARLDSSPEGRYALDEWAEALEGFFAHISADRWINYPVSNAVASHKLEQLTRAVDHGLEVPKTIVTQDAQLLRAFFEQCAGRLVVKPMASGYIERSRPQNDSLIYTNQVTDVDLANLSDLHQCPTLFQQYIDKSHDVRITLLDDDVHAVSLIARGIDGGQRCDVRRDNMRDVKYEPLALPTEVAARVKQLVRSFRLRFAAVDMVVSQSGDWYFLEINPNGQWAWLDISGGMDIASSFVKAFTDL